MTQPVPVHVETDPQQAAAYAASQIAQWLSKAIQERGTAALALSGGSTPLFLYVELSRQPVAWEKVHVFQVDERVAPDGDAHRNATHIERVLFKTAAVANAHWHPMPVTSPDLQAAASDYAHQLETSLAEGRFDVVHLGLGVDGHTASWPPGSPVLHATEPVAVVRSFNGFDRLTLTPALVNRSRHLAWLVTGADKQSIVARWLQHDEQLPSSSARRGGADTLIIDERSDPTFS